MMFVLIYHRRSFPGVPELDAINAWPQNTFAIAPTLIIIKRTPIHAQSPKIMLRKNFDADKNVICEANVNDIYF